MINYPKVSVITITYGHEKYIRQALDGVLMQEYAGEIEFIIANDNSPDATDKVVKDYFSSNHIPTKFSIKYTKHEFNKGMMPNFLWAIDQATGIYIALCEGDDYWTDPLKLQKQVDFLIDNPQYSFSCHRYQIYSEYDKKFENKLQPLKFRPYNEILGGVVVDKTAYHNNWLTQPLTTVIRKDALINFNLKQFRHFRDVHLFYILLLKNNGFCHNWNAGVYRKHLGGIYSGSKDIDRAMEAVSISEELYLFSKDNRFFKIYVANAIPLLKSKHLNKILRSFFIKLSMTDKMNLLRFLVQYFQNRSK